MGEVIHADFGTEREWRRTHDEVVAALIAVGGTFGDSEDLMRAKADAVHRILRKMVDDVPSVSIRLSLPGDLPEDLQARIENAARDAATKGVETAVEHSVQALMSSIYELCTSQLSGSSVTRPRSQMKLCKDCVHHHHGGRWHPDWCSGPHVSPSIISGERYMELPGARYSGGNGLIQGARPCGEGEAYHWRRRRVPAKAPKRWDRFCDWVAKLLPAPENR